VGTGNWAASMQAAIAVTLARPRWWAMALAAFLVRGGIVLVLVPLVSLPSTASVSTALAPSVAGLILGSPSLDGIFLVTLAVTLLLATLVLAALGGSWLDLALLRDACQDEELELGWEPVRSSARRALAIRLAAHVPTLIALGFAAVRLVAATYQEFMSPGDPSLSVAARVVLRAPDAVIVLGIAWLLGEAVGAIAARRHAAGEPTGMAFRNSLRQVAGARGLATLTLTTIVLAGIVIPFQAAAGRSWEQLRVFLFEGVDALQLAAALLLLVSTWVLGLALLGAALAWRASAWTVGIAPARAAVPVALEPVVVPAPEVAVS
jgi:hypothetical protein